MPIENLLSDDERRQLEAVRLIALARDLLSDERMGPVREMLDRVLSELTGLHEGRVNLLTVASETTNSAGH